MAFEIWVGGAVWGDMGPQEAHVAVAVNSGEDICGATRGAGRFKLNFPCEGCNTGGVAWEWYIDSIMLTNMEYTSDSATVDGPLLIERWPSLGDEYWATDDSGKWHALCHWPDEEEWESCYRSGPVDIVKYLVCDATPDRGDDYTEGIQFADY